MKDICRGLNYLKENEIIHRDQKTENLLLGCNKQLKVSDFGLSTKGKDIITNEEVGSLAFFAPETHKQAV